MQLLRNGAVVSDGWIDVSADGEVPTAGDVVLSASRLLADWPGLSERNGRLGVRLANTDRPEMFQALLPRLSLIVLPFPAFNDGRAYSIARKLREMGYAGELRATGNVLPDQMQFMLQVGFNSFEIGDRFPIEMWSTASRQMSLAYQRGLFRRDAESEIWTERHTDAEAWLEQPHAG